MEATIVIPAYNQAQWLAETITSALGQVDDGPTDETPQVARAFPVRYHRQSNGGLAAARNSGCDLASTKLICFLDSDDTIPPGFIQTLTSTLNGQPSDVAFAYSGIQFFGSEDRMFPPSPWSIEAIKRNSMVSATSLFRMSAIGSTRFDTRVCGWEDWEFAMALAASGYRGVPGPCAFNYRKDWDQPSMFDLLGQRSVNFAKARRHIARKHRGQYTPKERVRAELDVLIASAKDVKHRR